MFAFEKPGPDTNIIFCHVPKCAGTTLVAYLRPHYPATYGMHYQRVSADFRQWMDRKPRGNFVYGHLRSEDLDRLEASGLDYRLITFLRHPVERIRSWYRYDASPQSPIHVQFRKNHPNFERWAKQRPRNTISGFLAGDVSDEHEYLNIINDRFHFIGLQEHFEGCLRILCESMDIKYQQPGKYNISHPLGAFDAVIDPPLFAELAKLNELDVKVYNEIRSKWMLKLSSSTVTDA